jgi:hypothetical protein
MEKLDWYYYFCSQKVLIRTWKEFQKYWNQSSKIITNNDLINFYNSIGAFWITKELVYWSYWRTEIKDNCTKR